MFLLSYSLLLFLCIFPFLPSFPVFLPSFFSACFFSFLFFSDFKSVFSMLWKNYRSSKDWQITHMTGSLCFSAGLVNDVTWPFWCWSFWDLGSKKKYSRRQERETVGSEGLDWKAGACHFCHILLVKAVTEPSWIRGERSIVPTVNEKSFKKCVVIFNSQQLAFSTLLSKIVCVPSNSCLVFFYLTFR